VPYSSTQQISVSEEEEEEEGLHGVPGLAACYTHVAPHITSVHHGIQRDQLDDILGGNCDKMNDPTSNYKVRRDFKHVAQW
jgi:hypothetical protein